MATTGCTPSEGAAKYPATPTRIEPTLKNADESAGIPKRCRLFRMPIDTAASDTSGRKGNMTRVRKIVSSRFVAKP